MLFSNSDVVFSVGLCKSQTSFHDQVTCKYVILVILSCKLSREKMNLVCVCKLSFHPFGCSLQGLFSHTRFLFAVNPVKEDPGKYQHCPDPLVGEQGVAEHEDAAEDGEELPGGGDDGARQWTKLTHTHEDEELKQRLILDS